MGRAISPFLYQKKIKGVLILKTKTINAVINKKINEWLNSIDDKNLVKKIKNDIIVTGGAITSMLLNEPVNDFDIYFKTKSSLKLISEYYTKIFNDNNKNEFNKIKKPLHAWVLDGEDVDLWKQNKKRLSEFAFDYSDFTYNEVLDNEDTRIIVSDMIVNTDKDRIKIIINSDGIAEDSDIKADVNEYDINKYIEALEDADSITLTKTKNKYQPIFLSSNAITLSNDIQIVVRFYGNIEEIHGNYDFVHATNYWTYNTGTVLNLRALEATINKELFYIGSKYPICSLVRTRKFIKKGWQINAGQYVKMAFQISKLDLENISVLEDQLVGVDSLYFLRFINTLKNDSKQNGFILNQEYLSTVLDKIFG